MDEIRKIALECAARSLAGQPHCTEDVTLRADTFCEWLNRPECGVTQTVDPEAQYGRKEVISRRELDLILRNMISQDELRLLLGKINELHRQREMETGIPMRGYGYAINDFFLLIEKYFDDKNKQAHETDGI